MATITSLTTKMPLSLTIKRGRVQITMTCIPMGQDLIIAIAGGDREHIGAVAVGHLNHAGDNNDTINVSTITIPTHKEQELVDRLAHIFTNSFNTTSCIICGIHVEQILPSEIQDVLEMTEELAKQLITQLTAIRKQH